MPQHVAVSPLRVSTKGPPGNSASGSGVKRCHDCSRSSRETKETIRNGLRVIRVRYGLPYAELPDLEPSDLGRFHSFLLGQGKERASVPFPRRQRRGENGLCSLQRLRRHERWELALSVASIKRNLPTSCVRHTPSARSQWEQNAFSSPPPQSSEYLAFVKSTVSRLFTPGWDRAYGSFVMNHLPNASSREPKRSRADHLWAGRREEFINATTQETGLVPVLGARYKEVASAGKLRPLVIFDESVELLAPLHKLIYSHLRKQEWLLCGPPTDKWINTVCAGEFQTSVDLVSASDGLYHSVAETILDSLFFTSVQIPRDLRSLAKASLRPLVEVSDGRRAVTHGQCMGSYLCFPLLCLQSYCAARWAARDDPGARFGVNGDDCVISAARFITAEDYPLGFRLNNDKTIRASNVVEVNSTVFLKRRDVWHEVRHLRRGGACSTYEGMMHMAEAVSSRPCWIDAFIRSRIGRPWGFLPSQLGFRTYPSFRRETSMLERRSFSRLPVRDGSADDRLRCIPGDATAAEAEVLRDFLWENGRGKDRKRDVWSPSLGAIRRTYHYRSCRRWSKLTFVGWAFRSHASLVKRPVYFLPANAYTEKEEIGLLLLEAWRAAFPLVE